jgi:hypothetical protein
VWTDRQFVQFIHFSAGPGPRAGLWAVTACKFDEIFLTVKLGPKRKLKFADHVPCNPHTRIVRLRGTWAPGGPGSLRKVDQGTSMSQQAPTTLSMQCATGRIGFAALAAVCAVGFAGCQLAETFDYSKCTIPPNTPHEIEAPPSFGYFATMWRPWPGAEAVPGHSKTRKKSGEEAAGGEGKEELPPPTEETMPGGTPEPGLEDIFGPSTPEMEKPGEQAEEMPGEAAPPKTDETPDVTLPEGLAPPGGETPPNGETPPEGEAMPDELLPEDDAKPAAEPPQNRGAWNLESLPADAPEGALVPEEPVTVARKPARPELLMPGQQPPRSTAESKKPTENARRPAPNRGAATGAVRANSFGSSHREHDLRDTSPGADAAEGPRLLADRWSDDMAPRVIRIGRSTTRPAVANVSPEGLPTVERAASIAGERATLVPASETADAPPGRSGNAWRASSIRGDSKPVPSKQASAAISSEGWQRRASGGEYSTRQTSHIESQPARSAREMEPVSAGPSNPLR